MTRTFTRIVTVGACLLVAALGWSTGDTLASVLFIMLPTPFFIWNQWVWEQSMKVIWGNDWQRARQQKENKQ